MDSNSLYYKQVMLLVQVLPWLEILDCFAFKGGTAINLFVRDMPRLSIDIDLAYLPIEPRDVSLNHIHDSMMRLSEILQKKIPGSAVEPILLKESGTAYKFLIRHAGVQIKVEVTPVLRGTVYLPEQRSVMPVVENEFGYAEVQLVSQADLYGGKICSALDRQYPRDLFDVKLLLENEGINREMFKALLISVKRGDPGWSLIDLPHANELPAVQWKLRNLANMSENKRGMATRHLEQVLEQF